MAVMQGWTSWWLGYASVQAPMLLAMIRRKVSLRRLLLSPMAALPATLAAGIGSAIVDPMLSGLGLGASAGLRLTVGLGIGLGTGYLAGRALSRRETEPLIDVRGAAVPREKQWREARETIGPGELSLAGVRLSKSDETKHFKLIGTTGTGKSTAIARMLEAALARGDRAVIADPDGGYLRRFYDPGRSDVILNPFDQRSAKWDLFGEIRQRYDVDQLARSLIPDQGGEDRIWSGYGRTFFSAVTHQAHAAGVRDVGELRRLLVAADTEELVKLTHGTPAQPFLQAGNERMFSSLRSVTSSAVASLEYVAQQRAPSFSIRDWIDQERGGRGVLFIPYRAGQIAALRSTISAWMRIAIFGAMDRPEGDQRLWFVVDELDALGPIDGLKDALARVRKFGGRCVLGFQSVAQVAGTYGKSDAQTIVENCGNSFILRCSASEGGGTSRFASVLIGQREVRRTTMSRSTRDTEFFGSKTSSDHLTIEPAVMDSEIEQIPDLSGYLKIASRPSWIRLRMAAPEGRESGRPEVPAFVQAVVEVRAPGPTAPVAEPAAATATATATAHETPGTPADAKAATPTELKPKRRSRAKAAASPPTTPVAEPSRRAARSKRVNGAAPLPPSQRRLGDDIRGYEP